MSAPEIPVGWTTAALFDVVDVLDNLRVPVNRDERARRDGDVPYYGATGQVGWIDDHLFDEELVLLGEDGVAFFDLFAQKAYVISGKSWVNNHAHVLRPITDAINTQFLCHVLNDFNYNGLANGTTRLKLTKGAMAEMSFALPPRAEQDRIVDALDTALLTIAEGDSALDTTTRSLASLRRSLLTAATSGTLRQGRADDEPAEALLEAVLLERRERWEEAQLAAMAAKGQLPKNDKWKSRYKEPETPDSSATDELPSGWTWATVDQLAVAVEYGTSSKTNEDESGIPVLRMGNIVDGRLSLEKLKYLPEAHHEFPALLLKEGDLLFNRTNSPELVGKSAVYNGEPKPCSFASYLIRVRFARRVESRFVSYFLASAVGRTWINSVVNQQVGQANVNGTKLKALNVPLPPAAEQGRIVSIIERWLDEVEQVRRVVSVERARAVGLRRAACRRALAGGLVPQDSSEEAAAVMLARVIDRRRVATEGAKKQRLVARAR